MVIRSVPRSAFSKTASVTAALAAGLLVLPPVTAPATAIAAARTDPPGRTSGLPGSRPSTASPPAPASSGSATPGAGGGAARGAAPEGPVDGSLLYRSGTQVRLRPGAPQPPGDVSALSWLVADARTGEVLAARNAHRRLPPASTLKTLFAVTALPHLSERARHTVKESELEDIGPGSSLVGINAGESYEVADLWRGVFLSSGNDAVRALAEMNGGWDATVVQMQEKAKLLGALDTHVVSPDGYDAEGQVSSAYDLAVFGRTGLASPAFVRYSSTVDAQFPGYGGTFGIVNTNRLLSGEDGVEPYPGLIGIKNGYTSDAGYTLVAAARRGGRTLVVTVMNPQWGSGHQVYEEARSLLDWGFDVKGRARPVGSLQPPAPPVPPLPPSPTATAGPAGPGAIAKAVRTAPATTAERSARADGEGPGSGFPLPVVFTGSACLAVVALFLVRRRARRRPQGEWWE
ncbi:D-alanyl-D-alanine carboxypeptidase family protein [Streptomyces sp. NPDC088116]|uniref:D-alanyl-D-alanine carboxypeptidase family protein n=1 Tax=Streptomyces sp. NPDC088116 TaxID=3365825 RepID=UPI0038120FA7